MKLRFITSELDQVIFYHVQVEKLNTWLVLLVWWQLIASAFVVGFGKNNGIRRKDGLDPTLDSNYLELSESFFEVDRAIVGPDRGMQLWWDAAGKIFLRIPYSGTWSGNRLTAIFPYKRVNRFKTWLALKIRWHLTALVFIVGGGGGVVFTI